MRRLAAALAAIGNSERRRRFSGWHGDATMRLTLGLAIALVVAIAVPAADASFPGRNGRIVFVSNRAASPGQVDKDGDLYTIGADGKGLKTLTANRNFEGSPRWSPGGKRLVFTRSINLRTSSGWVYGTTYALHVIQADGSRVRKITSPSVMRDGFPSWSPSGRRIAFVRQPANSRGYQSGEILVVNADGTGLRRLGAERGEYGNLAWAPDGRHFAFRRGASELYVMDTDGSDVRRLLARTPLVSGFAWSPDARRIAFTRGDLPGIWAVNVDDTGEAALVPDVRAALNLSWSPDGREIAFETVDQRIAVATIGTGSVRVLGAGGVAREDFQPDWQPLP